MANKFAHAHEDFDGKSENQKQMGLMDMGWSYSYLVFFTKSIMKLIVKKLFIFFIVLVVLVVMLLFGHYKISMKPFTVIFDSGIELNKEYIYDYLVEEHFSENQSNYEIALFHQDYWKFNHLIPNSFLTDVQLGNCKSSTLYIEKNGQKMTLKKVKINKNRCRFSKSHEAKSYTISQNLDFIDNRIRNFNFYVYDPDSGEKWSYKIKKIDLSRLY